LCLLIAVLLVRGFARRPYPSPSVEPSERASTASTAQLDAQLRKACDANDPGAALAALAQIARARWPLAPPSGASGWGARLDAPALEAAIRRAEQARYAPDARDWKGSELWQTYRSAAKVRTRARGHGAILPDLYPSMGADAG